MADYQGSFTSLDYADNQLFSSLTRQPPAPAVPLNIPLDPNTFNSPESKQKLENAAREAYRQELQRNRALVDEQNQQQRAREEEIFKREQARRDEIARRTSSAQPPENDLGAVRSRDYESQATRPPSISGSRPNTGSPAPTMQGTAARVHNSVDPLAMPAPAALAEAIPQVAEIASPKSPPRGVPVPAGLVKSSAIGSVAGFGVQVLMGRPPGEAAFSSGSSFVGSIVGGTIGSFAGPIGTAVGSIIGGAIAGGIAEWILAQNRPSPASIATPQYVGLPPFKGGQNYFSYNAWFSDKDAPDPRSASSELTFTGKVISFERLPPWTNGFVFYARYRLTIQATPTSAFSQVEVRSELKSVSLPEPILLGFIPRTGFGPDSDPPSLPVKPDGRTPESTGHPGNREYGIPRGYPGDSQIPQPNNYVGGGKTGATPRGDSPNWIPHGGLAPRRNPNPTTTPSNGGGGLPSFDPNPSGDLFGPPLQVDPTTPALQPIADNAPKENQAYPRSTSTSSNPGNSSFGQYITFEKNPPTTTSIGGLPKTSSPSNDPDGVKKIAPINAVGAPKVGTDTTEEIKKALQETPTKKDFDDLFDEIKKQREAIAGIIPILGAIPANIAGDPKFKDAQKTTTQEAVCELTAPDKCLGSTLKNNADDIKNNQNQNQNNLLNKLNLAGQGVDLSLLGIINNKLGAQLPNGGISGYLQRGFKWLQIDRITNLLTLWVTIHNAAMLSAQLGDTLLSVIENGLTIFGVKDADGSAIDLNEILGKQIQEMIKSAIGAQNYTELVLQWKRASTIYRSTANVASSLTGFSNSIINGLEVVGSQNAKIGNALRTWGTVSEKAYEVFNPSPNFKAGGYFDKLNNLDEAANFILQVSQVPIDVMNAQKELNESTESFIKTLREETKKGIQIADAEKTKKLETDSKAASEAINSESTDREEAE